MVPSDSRSANKNSQSRISRPNDLQQALQVGNTKRPWHMVAKCAANLSFHATCFWLGLSQGGFWMRRETEHWNSEGVCRCLENKIHTTLTHNFVAK